MTKRSISFLLALVMAFTVITALAEDDEEFLEFDDEFTDEEFIDASYVYTGPEYDYDHLVIGNTTAVSGNFTTQLWGYNTSDVDVTQLINGYNLVRWQYEMGNFETDPNVVTGLTVLDDAEGNRIYVLVLKEGLKYSDGSPITAKDYAFNILLSTAPEVRALGGDTDNYSCILGINEYKNGETDTIQGVNLISDTMLSLTVSKEYRPFFYELGLLWCYPMPIDVIAPGCSIVEGENDAGQKNGIRIEGEFTEEILKKTLLDPETGYVSHPAIVSGPYKLTAYDPEAATVDFEINPNWNGRDDGILPTIPTMTLKPADNNTMMEQLENGEFGLLNKVLKADSIQDGIGMVGSGNYAMGTYARIGQSYIAFNCEKPPMDSMALRQAIAWCLDKDETVSRYSGNYGVRVDGYYGIGQWMYQVMTGAIEPPTAVPEENASAADLKAYEEELEKWEELNMDEIQVYNLDTDKAVQLLEKDGWTLNRNGEKFVPGTDDVRCKEIDGELIALDLTMVYPEGNEMGEILQDTFISNLATVGIKVTAEPMEWQKLLRQYYREEERTCEMMYLASNFNEVFDPWPTFDPADADIGLTNYTGIKDVELYEKARDMSQTEPGDNYTYEEKWLAFQKRYEEVMPAIPIYGNAYFDFYTRCLQNYTISDDVTWTEAIVPAYMSDPMAEIEETEEEE